MPNTMSQMTHTNLAFARLSIEQAMQHAMANFRSKLPQVVFESLGGGLFGSNNLADHQSAMLLLTPGSDYPLPAIHGAPIALAPTRNLFYLTGSASELGLRKLVDIAQQAGQMPHFCSSTLLQWDGHRWIAFDIGGSGDVAKRQREIVQFQLAADYDAQKQLLDRLHQKRGQDIFVANLMMFRRKDSSESFSVASLGSGTTGTLLPHADRLSFGKQIIDPKAGLATKTQEMADVAWSDAMEIAGHLFEPVAYLHPPRLRALGFPDAELWARLKAVAR
jgi:hypothetical protein